MIFGNRKLEAFKNDLGLRPDILASLPDAIEDSYIPAIALRNAAEQLNITVDEMQTYVPELLSFLVLASEQPTPMLSNKVDTLWHQFILCTKDYLNFCYKYFGKFIHHTPKSNVPISGLEKKWYKDSCMKILSDLSPERRQQYRAIADRRRLIRSSNTDDFFWSALLFTTITDIDRATATSTSVSDFSELEHQVIESQFGPSSDVTDEVYRPQSSCSGALASISGDDSSSTSSMSSCSSGSCSGGD